MTAPRPFSETMRIDLMPDEAPERQSDEAAVWATRPDVPDGPACPVVGSPDFRELLATLYDGAIITDLEGRIVNANTRATGFFACTLEALCTTSITELLAGSEADLLDMILESLENEQFVLIQAYCLRADGTGFPAEISVNHLHLSGADYLGFFIRDITQRKKTEDWLRTGSAAIENAADAIAAANLQGCLDYANPAAAKLLGVAAVESLMGRELWDFLDQPAQAEAIIRTVNARQTWAGQLRLTPMKGPHVDAQASFAPNINVDGELTGMVISLLDVTDQILTHQRLRDRNEQMEEDLQLAREFQQAFIRKQVPVFPAGAPPGQSAVTFSSIYRSSGAVGGDFFDLLPLSDTRVGVFISDVMGHGVRSALVAATVRGLLEELSVLADDPGTLLTAVNRDLHTVIVPGGTVAFVTACYMVLDLATGTATLASAGHPPPFWIQHASSRARRLELRRDACGPAMGLFADAEYRNDTFRLMPEDMLIFFTDGIGEAENRLGESYDDQRMKAFLGEHAGAAGNGLLDALLADAVAFHGSDRFEDDICLVGVNLRRLLP